LGISPHDLLVLLEQLHRELQLALLMLEIQQVQQQELVRNIVGSVRLSELDVLRYELCLHLQ
jgi:hypothetical protein